MNIKTKREIVRRFKAGTLIVVLSMEFQCMRSDIEQVLRDYMNNRFKLGKAVLL